METPNYYSIIPANVRYDRRLTPNSKLLYAEITSLTQMNGRCFASTSYFCDLYGVSKVSVQKWLKNLKDYGYIEITLEYKKGSKEILNRYITLVTYPSKEKFTTPSKEKFTDNITTNVDINNNLTESNNITNEKENNFNFENLNKPMQDWLEYKKSIKDYYKSDISVKACYDRLKKISNNDEQKANEIIQNAIAMGYKGFFELKENKQKSMSARSIW